MKETDAQKKTPPGRKKKGKEERASFLENPPPNSLTKRERRKMNIVVMAMITIGSLNIVVGSDLYLDFFWNACCHWVTTTWRIWTLPVSMGIPKSHLYQVHKSWLRLFAPARLLPPPLTFTKTQHWSDNRNYET